MISNYSLFSIGHGTRSQEEFLELLKENNITYLVDVRTVPHSRFNPQYNKRFLNYLLPQHNINYVYMGDELGGRPKDPSCYNKDGKINYETISQKDCFIKGIDRLKTAYSKKLNLALMCSERNPCQCHRSILIGKALSEQGISLHHIDEQGKIKDQEEVMALLNKKTPATKRRK